ncbi:MAG: MgtC/SapB family protein [Candidatus Aenigmatarchaeota archaeon]|nr:MAG: MgtC/SapB family protein [Candidatus Aenigmarchaeota archaeon]
MLTEIDILMRILLSAALGGLIGFERQRRHRSAGFRTNLLVCLGACLITMTSLDAFSGADPARVAAGIVTGIGFLGAGTIIRTRGAESQERIEGLTTAAVLWVVAGIGLAVGAGYYFAAIVSTAVIFLVLCAKRIERWME